MPDATTDEPYVFTSKGNLPASLLEEFCEWEVTPDYVACKPGFRLKETGEVVKRSCHVVLLKGEAALPQQAQL